MDKNNISEFDLRNLRGLIQSGEKLTYQNVMNFFNQSPQLQFAGIQVQSLQANEVLLTIPKVEVIHQGGLGSHAINGGVIAMLCDLTIGLLGVDLWKNGFTATQSLSIDYLRPLLASQVFSQGKIEKVVGNKIIALIEISNEQGDVCACAQGVLATGLKER